MTGTTPESVDGRTSELDASARAGFVSRFGAEPLGVWGAPGRVNLIGEHTDYNEGFVFPFAIDRLTVVALAPRTDSTVRIASSFAETVVTVDLASLTEESFSSGELPEWSAYPLGIAWALAERVRAGASELDPATTLQGFDAFVDSDVPVGAGLSSSAALLCAVAVALDEVWSLGLDRATLARVGQLAENKAVGAPTGIMDECASLFGRRDAAVFLDCRSLDLDVIPLGFAEAGLELLVIDTRVSHAHATGGYASRRASCEAGAAALGVSSLRDLDVDDLPRAEETLDDETYRRVKHIITENRRVLDTVRTLRESGPAAIGPILDAGHASLRDDFEISVPELDTAVEASRAAGALGARMTGGGFGGAAIALVPTELTASVCAAVEEAFSARGFTAPNQFVVQAADGAHRLS